MTDLVTISNGALTARINPLGAELWSLADAQGREYMTDADPRFWTGHAPLLFPIVGALRNGSYRLDGREYALPKHGFARTSRFAVAEARADHARFRLEDSEATRAAWPFAFVLEAEFALEGATLAMAVTVHNAGERPMPFSFGFHPAFAWPLPDGGAKGSHRVIFAKDEPAPVRRIDPASGTLRKQPQPTPVTGRELAPDASLFAADALIWDRLASRSLTFAGESGPSLKLDFPDCPHLGVWQKPGAPFLAIEPWQGFNDPEGFAGELREKPGIVVLAAGAQRRFRLDVTVADV
jgi:galactose mutarotase-like enzyme